MFIPLPAVYATINYSLLNNFLLDFQDIVFSVFPLLADHHFTVFQQIFSSRASRLLSSVLCFSHFTPCTGNRISHIVISNEPTVETHQLVSSTDISSSTQPCTSACPFEGQIVMLALFGKEGCSSLNMTSPYPKSSLTLLLTQAFNLGVIFYTPTEAISNLCYFFLLKISPFSFSGPNLFQALTVSYFSYYYYSFWPNKHTYSPH